MASLGSYPDLELEGEGPIARLRLNRPDVLNALSMSLMEQIIEACVELNARPGLKVVIVSGNGRAFSSGVDLGDFTTGGGDEHYRADLGRRMAEAVESIEAVTIAQIHGFSVGGGIVLAAACDLGVAAVDTIFRIPELELGIPLGWGGIPRLIRAVGPAVTKELVLTCRKFGAGEALQLGLLNRVVPAAQLGDEVAELTETLASRSRMTLLSTIRAVDTIANAAARVDSAPADAASMILALHDSESRAVASHYLASLGFDA